MKVSSLLIFLVAVIARLAVCLHFAQEEHHEGGHQILVTSPR